MKFLFVLVFSAFLTVFCRAENSAPVTTPDSLKTQSCAEPSSYTQIEKNGEASLWKIYPAPDSMTVSDSLLSKADKTELKDKLKRRKKIFATLLAFPIPFGIIGLHRIYLGTKPYVPLVYIATIGGAVGIIPFIDFIVLLLEKDISKYENNPNIVMWAK